MRPKAWSSGNRSKTQLAFNRSRRGGFSGQPGNVLSGPGCAFGRCVRRRSRAAAKACLHLLYAVFEEKVEPAIVHPTFVTDFSVSVSPLARRRDGDPAVVDRFELFCAGMEIANAFSELSDPVDQRQRFVDQLRHKERGDDEAHGLDEDFIRALETGMPPRRARASASTVW